MRLGQLWVIGLVALAICSFEAGLRLGANSPDTRFTLPQYSLGYFWDTPLGWTGVVSGVPVNKDSVQFASLASFFRDEPFAPVPLEDNVYTRFAGYALIGSFLAPLVGAYASFVLVNVLFWVAAAVATYALAVRFTGSRTTATRPEASSRSRSGSCPLADRRSTACSRFTAICRARAPRPRRGSC